MKRALFLIDPHLLVELFKAGPTRAFEVTDFALPEDARFVDVRYINSEGAIALELESETFNEMPPKAKQPPVLSTPVCRIVTEEELVERFARMAAEHGAIVTIDIPQQEVPGAPEPIEES